LFDVGVQFSPQLGCSRLHILRKCFAGPVLRFRQRFRKAVEKLPNLLRQSRRRGLKHGFISTSPVRTPDRPAPDECRSSPQRGRSTLTGQSSDPDRVELFEEITLYDFQSLLSS
jgi:hypothetical protein